MSRTTTKNGGTGLECPVCSSNRSRVLDTMARVKTDGIVRRRACRSCKAHFTTRELVIDPRGAVSPGQRVDIPNRVYVAGEDGITAIPARPLITADVRYQEPRIHGPAHIVYVCDPLQFGARPTCACQPENFAWRPDGAESWRAACKTCGAPYRFHLPPTGRA
jgi:hypothetical protein